MYQEYYFTKAMSSFNSYIAKPLGVDYAIDILLGGKMHIEMIFECNGVPLSKMKPVSIELGYSLMLQSADILLILSNLGITHVNINSDSIFYDNQKEVLKFIGLGSILIVLQILVKKQKSQVNTHTTKMHTGSILNLDFSLCAADVYYWAMTFFEVLVNKEFKAEQEEDIKRYIKIAFPWLYPAAMQKKEKKAIISIPVSYTHLTLPTICSV
eukprot:TRINITY_DN10908_c0_g1_i2.p1 TRINITY_DN10908_c0_g1~~TRINITY_DN10908_c0_g1_i2.p1  ORF type:complete len:212 (+),score=10.73 TRINITY_DN10908_c0_g1_i2:222-857(+)